MNKRIDPYPPASGSVAGGEHEANLPFEAEFDGARRSAEASERLCDPQRYWTIFDGTD